MASSHILSWIHNLMPYKSHEVLVMKWSTLIVSSNDLNCHYWMVCSKLEEKIKLNNFPLYLDNLTLHIIIFYSHQQKELDSLFRLIHVCHSELELIDAPSDQSSFPLTSPACCSRSDLKRVCTHSGEHECDRQTVDNLLGSLWIVHMHLLSEGLQKSK